MMKVLITGGSGLVGMALTKKLISEGIEVTHLSRTKNSKAGVKTYVWDYKRNYLEENALSGVSHIAHLAGEGIADKPWTMSRKRKIVKSRVLTARLLLNECIKQNIALDAFISASGIGYYGAVTIPNKTFDENDDRGKDFVAECCVQWENQADKFNNIARVVKFRTGIVLSKGGGALEKLESSIKRGFGAPLGSGKQAMPWIHIDDIVKMYHQAIVDSKLEGTYNAVANSDSNEVFTKELAKAMNKKLWLPNVPKFMMKLIFGEMADILLEGTAVSNEKILETGISLKYQTIDSALTSIYED